MSRPDTEHVRGTHATIVQSHDQERSLGSGLNSLKIRLGCRTVVGEDPTERQVAAGLLACSGSRNVNADPRPLALSTVVRPPRIVAMRWLLGTFSPLWGLVS